LHERVDEDLKLLLFVVCFSVRKREGKGFLLAEMRKMNWNGVGLFLL
jgi:hypothetical protein